MLNKEREIYIQDTLLHKSLVLQEANKLFIWLCKNGKRNVAEKLAKAALIHDDSKLSKLECSSMAKIKAKVKPEEDSMKDPNVLPNDDIIEILENHWKNNRHHPEHFPNVNDMKEHDIAEMVCDWSARSIQYGTNLMEFAKTRLENRFFAFSEENKRKILLYCKVLIDNR